MTETVTEEEGSIFDNLREEGWRSFLSDFLDTSLCERISEYVRKEQSAHIILPPEQV